MGRAFSVHTFAGYAGGALAPAMLLGIAAWKDDTRLAFAAAGLAGLIAGTQMNVLEWHLWGSRRDDVERPERIIFDIDPDEGLDFGQVREAAVIIRDELEELLQERLDYLRARKGQHKIGA